MPKYKASMEVTKAIDIVIDADNETDALNKLVNGDYQITNIVNKGEYTMVKKLERTEENE